MGGRVEVERKFAVEPGTESSLVAARLTLLSTTYLLDVYFDTPLSELSRSDYWLRTRNRNWELKCPRMSGSGLVDSRIELLEEADITAAIASPDATAQGVPALPLSLNEAIQSGHLVPLAKLLTVRKEYGGSKIHPASLVIDECWWGDDVDSAIEDFCELKKKEDLPNVPYIPMRIPNLAVGEVELLVEKDFVQEAEAAVGTIISKLGLSILPDKCIGKLHGFFMSQPETLELLAELQQRGLFPSSP